MSLDIEPLESKIRAILSAPGVDLNTISAKRVRKRLMEDDSTLTMEVVKDNKEEIDDLIGRVYAEVNEAEHGSEEEETKSNKRRSRDDEHEVDGDEDEEGKAAPKKKKAKKGQEKSDEKLARKLSNEINGRATRAGKGRSNGTSKKGRSKKSAKSATTVDSDDQGEDEEGGKKKKKRGGGGKGGFGKEYGLRYAPATSIQLTWFKSFSILASLCRPSFRLISCHGHRW